MTYHYTHEDPTTWFRFNPLIIAHDVGRSRDRSTAVIGGNSPIQPRLLGIRELNELPLGLYASARASELAKIDRRYNHNALIVADLSTDASYAENLFETFRSRLIGLQISRHGDGTGYERWQVLDGSILVYTIGRTYLLELYHRELQSRLVRIVDSPMAQKAYAQLEALEVEYRDTGTVYACLPGHHDDLGISCAMLAWAARHPHLPYWFRAAQPVRPAYHSSMSAAAVWRACT
jgi:hypothetical protein